MNDGPTRALCTALSNKASLTLLLEPEALARGLIGRTVVEQAIQQCYRQGVGTYNCLIQRVIPKLRRFEEIGRVFVFDWSGMRELTNYAEVFTLPNEAVRILE